MIKNEISPKSYADLHCYTYCGLCTTAGMVLEFCTCSDLQMLIKTFSPLSDLVFRHIPNTHTSCIKSGIYNSLTTSFRPQSPASGITNWKSGLLLSAAVGAGLSLPSGGYLMQINGAVYRRFLQGSISYL